MDRDGLTEFSGLGGQVIRGVFGPASFFNGLTVVFFLFGGGWFLAQMGGEALVTPLGDAVLALALARFSLNGMAGERSGTIVSTAGGSWGRVAGVAARYLALSLLWLVPLVLLGFRAETIGQQTAAAVMGFGTDGAFIAIVLLLAAGMAIAPPIFLISATRAENFVELADPGHWKRLFGGRLGDLLVVYVLYVGGAAAAFALALPVVIGAFAAGHDFGVFMLSVMAAFVGGVAITLLGRLCGFYAFGEIGGGSAEQDIHPPATPGPARVAAPKSPPRHAPPAPAVPGAAPTAEAGPAPGVAAAAPGGKPPLTDAVQRVEEARRRFAADPAGAIASLEALRDSHAPSPPILHAHCLLLFQAGRQPEALQAAREAIPILVERGGVALAADIARHTAGHVKELGLATETLLAVATALLRSGGLGHAASIYAAILKDDASERRAVKGLLQVADLKQRDAAGAAEAVKIYRYLLQHCASSPLADDMRRGLAEAETRLARAS